MGTKKQPCGWQGKVYHTCTKHSKAALPSPGCGEPTELRVDGPFLTTQMDILGGFINGLYSAMTAHEKAKDEKGANELKAKLEAMEGLSEFLGHLQRGLENGDVTVVEGR